MTEVMIGGTGTALINILFLAILFVVALAIARLRSLFAIVMLSGVYSLVSAAWYILVDAVDVGFTEAAVGAGMMVLCANGATSAGQLDFARRLIHKECKETL